MSANSASNSGRPASSRGSDSEPDRVYVIELKGERYRIDASGRQSAKYAAASTHKEQSAGPDIGQSVEELASIASIIGSLRK